MSSETVIRQVGPNIWTFSRPFSRFGIFPVGGRSTAVRLTNGKMWVLASTPLTPETQAKLDDLGPVEYIMGADAVHGLYLGEFQRAYPKAKLIGVAAHVTRASAGASHLKDLRFDGAYGRDAHGTRYGFESEIDACYFPGFRNKDVAFRHAESKSLVVADLLFNLPPIEQYSQSSSRGTIRFPLLGTLALTPWGWAHKRFVWWTADDKAAMKRDSRTVAKWDFDRIIPCHGDVIEERAKEAWCEAYKFFLD